MWNSRSFSEYGAVISPYLAPVIIPLYLYCTTILLYFFLSSTKKCTFRSSSPQKPMVFLTPRTSTFAERYPPCSFGYLTWFHSTTVVPTFPRLKWYCTTMATGQLVSCPRSLHPVPAHTVRELRPQVKRYFQKGPRIAYSSDILT